MQVLFVTNNILIEHLGIMYISRVLKEAGYQTELVEAEYSRIKNKLTGNIPTILAYNTLTIYLNYYLELNINIKKDFKVFSVFGGPHPTFYPEMINEEGVDGVCIGEGEYAMLELVDNLVNGRSIRGIRNWWIKEDGEVFKNPLRPLIENLDELPFPDRELYWRNKYFDCGGEGYFITTRGCPFSCSYCFNHAYRRLYGDTAKKTRRRSIDNVIEEIKEVKSKYKIRFVSFYDDTFILFPEWIEEFCYKYKDEVGLPFRCTIRADLITSDIVRHLKVAGCHSVSMGIEIADDYLQKTILRRSISREQILRAARLVKREGLKLYTLNIVAIPGGSINTDIETLKLNIECKPELTYACFLAPYPRTDIYDLTKGMGLIDDNLNMYLDSKFPLVNRRSYLKFKNIYEKRRVENLQKLFLFTVKFPFLLPLVLIMIKFPFGQLYFYISLFCSALFRFFFSPCCLWWTFILRRLKNSSCYIYNL